MAAVEYFEVMFNTFYLEKICTYVLPKKTMIIVYYTTANSKYFT
jgi:hypothetical protein